QPHWTFALDILGGSLRNMAMLSWLSLCVLCTPIMSLSLDSKVTLVEWRKSTVSSCYLYFFRNLRSYDNYQCDMFKGRVKLLEPSVGNANWSVILRNVSVADTGLYTCELTVINTTTGQIVESEGRVNLTVSELTTAPFSHSPQPRGRPGIIAALILLLTTVFLSFSFLERMISSLLKMLMKSRNKVKQCQM
uniref:Immunoglobulin V-set domain-containing protein n=1 Tax=Pundamilia nyererei TaxID=303518 RepID=A0A3B4H728_9CICH